MLLSQPHASREPAWTRFFAITEMFDLVGLHLQKKDLAILMRTCRFLQERSTPLFYQELNMIDVDLRLSESEDGLRALARNAGLIRAFKMREGQCRLYYLSTEALGRSNAAVASSLSPPVDKPTSSVNTTPHPSLDDLCRQVGQHVFVAQLGYVLQFSPNLTTLYLDGMVIVNECQISFLAEGISRLATLQTLSIEVKVFPTVSLQVIPGLFFSCPQSLKSFSIRLNAALNKTLVHDRDEIETMMQALEKPLPEQHCPELILLELPSTEFPEDVDTVTQAILTYCPKLQHIARSAITSGYSTATALAIISEMPSEMLQSFRCPVFREEEEPLVIPLRRHYTALRSIELDNCGSICGSSIQEILFNCSALEVFVVDGYYGFWSDVRLEDVVAQKWACTNLKRLSLFVYIGLMDELPRIPFQYLTEQEEAKMASLELFYRQIGSLTGLVHLGLKVSHDQDDLDMGAGTVHYRAFGFPCLLSLGDGSVEGQRGYLQLLAGLKDLEVLEGSFNSESGWSIAMGEAEFRWVKNNWPKLRLADFYYWGDRDRWRID
ncbi:hypothetical protein BGX29_007248 [Mortierella sp. GBA35]|nr:hypothetical protein BGX29_007248 [Mortierella sp. GBA35]